MRGKIFLSCSLKIEYQYFRYFPLCSLYGLKRKDSTLCRKVHAQSVNLRCAMTFPESQIGQARHLAERAMTRYYSER